MTPSAARRRLIELERQNRQYRDTLPPDDVLNEYRSLLALADADGRDDEDDRTRRWHRAGFAV
jgi:hypothetical protein